MPGKHKWYNFRNGGMVPPIHRNEGGATPAPLAGQPTAQSNAQAHNALANTFIQNKYDTDRWASNLIQGQGDRISALENAGYLTQADLPQQQDISGISQNAQAIQDLQNAGYLTQGDLSGIRGFMGQQYLNSQIANAQRAKQGRDIKALQNAGYITADQVPTQDISGIDANAQAIADLQNAGYLTAADLPAQQDISGISANAARLAALEGRAPQDISGIADNAARLAALEGRAPQDISGIGQNAQAIQALQNAGYLTAADLPAQQDISGIGQNQAEIQGLRQQLASLPPGYDDSGIRSRLQALESIPQQDISGIANNAAAIQALQNAPQQDISGIADNAARLAALEGRAPQDISGIANNAAAIRALQNAPQQDITGIGRNAAAIQALQQNMPQQQDISGIGNNASAISALQQQIANLSNPVPRPDAPPRPDRPTRPGPRGPRGPGRSGPNTPNTNTGIVNQGAARPYIDQYFAGESPFGQLDFSGYQGTQGGGASNYGYNPVQQPVEVAPTPTPTPPPPSAPPPPAPVVETTPTPGETYGEYGSGVSDEAQEIREQYVDPELPFDPFDQADKAAGTSWGGGVDEVIDARETLPEEFVPPPAPPPGSDKETGNAVVEEAFENFGEALNSPDLSNVQKAAANPAFNPEVAQAAAEVPVTIETPAGETYTVPARDLNSVDANAALGTQYSAGVDESGYIDPFGGTAPENGGTNAIAEAAEQEAKAAGASETEAKKAGTEAKKKAERKQYEILGNSVLAAGVSNIGGKFNQSGENQGLKDDWLVVGDSKGGQEVWAPDGKTYDSVEAAKKAGGSKDKDKKEPSVRDKALTRAKEIAQRMADAGPSRREQNEINARAAAAREAEAKAAAERQAHLDTLTKEQQYEFRANEAIQSRDRGDLKNLMREMGIRYKKDDSSSKLIRKLETGLSQRQAPPPVAPPPTPPPQQPVQVTPAPVQTAPPPPPTPQVTPAPAAPPAPPPPPPKPVEEVTPKAPALPPAIQNVNLNNSGSMKTAIYAARKAGIPIKSGSLRKKSSSELRRMLQQAGLA